ncbi:MAG TPA: hypothetical protein VFB32_12945 [Rudaea sp.]|nr:hypothetical protein [Rudaea sp.]
MANITLTIDQATLDRARARAAAEKTSVNALIRGFLENYVNQRERAEQLIALMDDVYERNKPSSGGRKFRRDDLYRRF